MDWKTPDKEQPWRCVIYTNENRRIDCDSILQVTTNNGELGVVFIDDFNETNHILYYAADKWTSIEIYLPAIA